MPVRKFLQGIKAFAKKNRPGKKRQVWLRVLLVLALLSLTASAFTMAKYTTENTGFAKAAVASLVQGGSFQFDTALDTLTPGSTSYVNFQVTNYEGEKLCEVAMDYEIQVESMGNLPLQFQLSGRVEPADTDGSSSLVNPLEGGIAAGGVMPHSAKGKVTHVYQLAVTWPESYDDEAYSDEIDMVSITVKAEQQAG